MSLRSRTNFSYIAKSCRMLLPFVLGQAHVFSASYLSTTRTRDPRLIVLLVRPSWRPTFLLAHASPEMSPPSRRKQRHLDSGSAA